MGLRVRAPAKGSAVPFDAVRRAVAEVKGPRYTPERVLLEQEQLHLEDQLHRETEPSSRSELEGRLGELGAKLEKLKAALEEPAKKKNPPVTRYRPAPP